MRCIPVLALVTLLAGCGAAPPPEPQPVAATAPVADDGLAVSGLKGTLPTHEVERVFEARLSSFGECYALALDRYEAAAGTLGLALAIGADGRVEEVTIARSELGSLDAEQCIRDRIRRFPFPRPRGGPADATYSLTLEAPDRPPTPVDWPASRVAPVLDAHRAELDALLAGTDGITVTLYIGAAGRVLDAGAASESRDSAAVATRLARVIATWTFPDPGAEVAKVTLSF